VNTTRTSRRSIKCLDYFSFFKHFKTG